MSTRLITSWKAGLACLAGLFIASHAHAITSAGTLFVDLDARDASAGTALWANNGSLGGAFTRNGTPTVTNLGPKGTAGVTFNGTTDFYRGASSPAGLTGAGAAGTRTIEVWAFNPALAGEETLVSLAKRGGPNGSNVAFNYGNNGDFGAVGHWAGADIGWINAPAAGTWHHLVYTFDGTTTRVYADGGLKNLENSTAANGGGALNAHDAVNMLIAAQMEPDGNTVTGGLRGSLTIANVRIHDDVLSSAGVFSNFKEEASRFLNVELTPTPAHRYSFDGNVNDSIGGAHGTLVNGTGTAAFVGGALNLNNNPAVGSGGIGNYVELPITTVNGKSALTIEAWGTYTNAAATAWSRIFDFGNQTPAGDLGSEYIFLTPKSGPNDTRMGIATPALNQPGFTGETDVIVGGLPLNLGEEVHMAATYDDATDVMRLFINGQLAGEVANARNLVDIDYAFAWLGRSLYDGDAYLQGSYNEFRIYNSALNGAQILGNYLAGPDNLNQIPEPATAVLGLMSVGLLALRRRRAA